MEYGDKQEIFIGGVSYIVDDIYAEEYLNECLESIEKLRQELDANDRRIRGVIFEMMSNTFFEEFGDRVVALLNKHQKELMETIETKKRDVEKTAAAFCPFEL